MPPIIVTIALTTAFSLVYMVRSLAHRPVSPALQAACLGMLALMLSILVSMVTSGAEVVHPIAAVHWWLSVAQHVLVMGGAYGQVLFFLYSVHPRPVATTAARRHGAVLLAAIAVAVAFAALASPPDYSAGFVSDYADAPFSSLYLLVFALYLTVTVTSVAGLAWRWSRRAEDPWIRSGMTLGAMGTSIAVAYCCVKVGFLVLTRLDVPIPTQEKVVTGPLILFSLPLALIGLTVPGWGPRLTALIRWAGKYRAHHELHTLWRALTEQNLHIRMSLDSPRRGGRLRRLWDERWAPHPRHIDLRLHLRVVQIWDARRVLTAYSDPAVRSAERQRAVADGLTGDALASRVEAVVLADALRRQRRGESAVGTGTRSPVCPKTTDLAANVLWLRRISKVFLRIAAEPGPAAAGNSRRRRS